MWADVQRFAARSSESRFFVQILPNDYRRFYAGVSSLNPLIRTMNRLVLLLFLVTGLPVMQAKKITCLTCSQDDFEHAYYVDSQPGDIIELPAGNATWGNSSRANNGTIFIITNVTVTGQGASTVITLDDSGATFSNGVIAVWAAATFKNMKIIGSNVNPVSAFNVSSYNNTTTGINFTGGFRLSNITYQGGTSQGYFAFVGAGVLNGLIDNCTITGNSGAAELIFVRGPSDAWQTASQLGAANNIFIENCTFGGSGYVCDVNSNGRAVVRFCTINGQNKIDGHGLASNSPARGVREMEVYNNAWTATSGTWSAIEIRGGTAMIFDNTAAASTNTSWFYLTDYGYQAQWPNFGNLYQTPTNYPLGDQIGVGQDPKVGASQPAYVFNNRKNGSAWPRTFNSPQVVNITTDAAGYPVGTTDVHLASSLGVTLNTGNAVAIAGDAHRYLIPTTDFSVALDLFIAAPGLLQAIPAASTAATAGAVTLYQQQSGNPGATFTEADIIKSNRDFFADTGFDTSTGVSRGTTAQMNALNTTGFPVGYGFWVTDQGSWNLNLSPNTSGLLYTWNGSTWVLSYTPYTYPHPLRRPIAPSNLQLGP
jgi:hypothetical protein